MLIKVNLLDTHFLIVYYFNLIYIYIYIIKLQEQLLFPGWVFLMV